MPNSALEPQRLTVASTSAADAVTLFWGLEQRSDIPSELPWSSISRAEEAEVLCLERGIGHDELARLLCAAPLKPVVFGSGGPGRRQAWRGEREGAHPPSGQRDLRERLTDAHGIALRIRELRAVAGHGYRDDVYRLALAFAYTRHNRIRAFIGADQPTGVVYDLDAALAGLNQQPTDSRPILASLVSSGYLREHLAEVAHDCPSCGSIQILFRDACISCGSPAIGAVELLHHFRCGRQGPEPEFLTPTGLYVCPKCRRELRHFGLDYDKPGEVMVCEHCGHTSAETAVYGRCLSCKTSFPSSQAPKLHIYDYELSEAGMHAVLSGQARVFDPVRLLGEHLPLMPLDMLFLMARKLVALEQRADLSTLIVIVSFERAVAASRTTGDEIRLLVRIGMEVVGLIRATDVVAYDRGKLYLVMPAATKSDTDALRSRLTGALSAMFQAEIVNLLQWRSIPARSFLESDEAPSQ